MNHKISVILSYLAIIFLYLSPFFLLHAFSERYMLMVSEELAHQFIKESYETGITESSYTSFIAMQSKIGGTVTLLLEGRDRVLTDIEIRQFLQSGTLKISQDEFLSCHIDISNIPLRIGGRP